MFLHVEVTPAGAATPTFVIRSFGELLANDEANTMEEAEGVDAKMAAGRKRANRGCTIRREH
jgi:hypothetical protein